VQFGTFLTASANSGSSIVTLPVEMSFGKPGVSQSLAFASIWFRSIHLAAVHAQHVAMCVEFQAYFRNYTPLGSRAACPLRQHIIGLSPTSQTPPGRFSEGLA
jgi:hypothetical protein